MVPEGVGLDDGEMRGCVRDDDVVLGQVGEVGAQGCLGLFDDVGARSGEGGFELIEAAPEELDREGYLLARFPALGVHLEVLEVAPAVDDEEPVLLRAPGFPLEWIDFEYAGAASDHLPELRVAVHGLGENEVDDLADVHAGVEHVHADGDPGEGSVLELVEQAALAVDEAVVGYEHPGQFALVLGVHLVEELLEPAGVVLCDGEEDGLAGQGAGRVLDALLHELPDDERVGAGVRDLPFEIGALEVDVFDVFAFGDELLLDSGREDTAFDALELELGADLQNLEFAQVGRIVLGGLFIGVREGGIVHVAVEEPEGVVIDVVSGGCREADGEGVEVVEDALVDVVDAPVAFVGDDRVEEMRRNPVG